MVTCSDIASVTGGEVRAAQDGGDSGLALPSH